MEDREYEEPPQLAWICIATFVVVLIFLSLTTPPPDPFFRDTVPWGTTEAGM